MASTKLYTFRPISASADYWLPIHELDLIERYKKAKLEIALVLRFGTEGNDLHLIFGAIPNVGIGRTEESRPSNGPAAPDHSCSHGNTG